MTDQNKDKLPTNEDIIDDLTKDIDEQFKVNDSSEPNIIDPDTEYVPKDFDQSDNEDSKSKGDAEVEDDFIDEAALKAAEESVTDEEKEERHKKSLELKTKGNEEFKKCKYMESIETYTEALRLCPLKYTNDRSIFYANRAASKMKVDRLASAIDDCSKAIELNDKYVRAYLRRAKLYEDTEKLDESLKDYEHILLLDPGNADALKASHRLPPLINERNEKLKTEMFGKLKEVGNLFLRPFGLSTDNFQMQQDPNSGGYSINFQQNAPKSN